MIHAVLSISDLKIKDPGEELNEKVDENRIIDKIGSLVMKLRSHHLLSRMAARPHDPLLNTRLIFLAEIPDPLFSN